MAVHYLKTWPQYFAAIISGKKTFEIRKNDREFKIGDSLCLQEFIPDNKMFTGRVWVVVVTYIFKGGAFGVDSSYCVLGIRQLLTAELGIKLNVTQPSKATVPQAEIAPCEYREKCVDYIGGRCIGNKGACGIIV